MSVGSEQLLVTACDTGSANAMAPVLTRLACPYTVLAQPHAARIFERWNIPCIPVGPFSWQDLAENGRRLFGEYRPKAVLAGTSWGPTVDKALTLAVRERNIPCAAVIEHWDLYRERFSRVGSGELEEVDRFMPERIWVNDGIAREEAIAAGLPAARIEVVGQPHLEHQIRVFQVRSTSARDQSIVFISERVREDFPPDSTLYRGFDEFSVLEALLQATEPAQARILVKLHPQEPPHKYDDFLRQSHGKRMEIIREADNAALAMSAGRIVGMYSMLLLEAALVREDVISFMPGGEPSMFIGNRLGATLPARTKEELQLLLDDTDTAQASFPPSATSFGARFLGSSDRMMKAIERLIA